MTKSSHSSPVTIKGEGTPILFLHSSLASKSQWERSTHVLSQEYQTVAVDLWGYGARKPVSHVKEDFKLEHECEMILAHLDKILKKNAAFHIIGHSYGGAVALRLAKMMPNRILSLSLFEPVSFHLLSTDNADLRAIKRINAMCQHLLRAKKPYYAAEIFVDYWSGPETFKSFSSQQQQALERRFPKVLMDFNAIFHDPLKLEDFRHLPFLTHLITGRQSQPIAKAIVDSLHDSLIYSTVNEVNTGHLGPITHPALINQLLYNWYMPNQLEMFG